MTDTMRAPASPRLPRSAADSCARRYRDPRARDRLHRECGRYLRMSAKLQKQIAAAGGIDPADVSRMCNGDPNAPKIVTAYVELVKRLDADAKTTAAFLIAGSIVEATQVATEAFTLEELRERLRVAQDSEDRAQAREDIAEKQVARVEADLHAQASPETFAAYAEALDEHREASIEELSWSLEVQIVGRALLARYRLELGIER